MKLEKNILVIDDQVYMHKIVNLTFTKNGYIYHQANSGKEAIELLNAGLRPSAILLDLMMPDIDGFEALQTIKKIPALANTPVIILSGKTNEADKISALRAGAVKFITKPFKPKELFAEVEEAIFGNILENSVIETEIIEALKISREKKLKINARTLIKLTEKFAHSKPILLLIVYLIGENKVISAKSAIIGLIKTCPFQQTREKAIWALGQIGLNATSLKNGEIDNNRDVEFLFEIADSTSENLAVRILACQSIKQLGYANLVDDLLEKLKNEFAEHI